MEEKRSRRKKLPISVNNSTSFSICFRLSLRRFLDLIVEYIFLRPEKGLIGKWGTNIVCVPPHQTSIFSLNSVVSSTFFHFIGNSCCFPTFVLRVLILQTKKLIQGCYCLQQRL
ncbi:uncharacterized protein LOC143469501 isoform X2 [Clavelina lepadiformis]|uniref:uncharacterized protein LOC143469501 isoform X2 n=1 Tax=Clavelina lepadiformis TaxID=159417 RepID=UPI0040419D56